MRQTTIGVIGCGMISSIYLQNCTQTFDTLHVAACADLQLELAQQQAAAFGIPRACTVDELLADPTIAIVLNLTSPQVHAAVNRSALHAGKHVYTEKPFALNAADADAVLDLARANGLRVGCAPDTFLGAGLQTCRKLIDDGWIGTPYAASGTILMGTPNDATTANFASYLGYGWDPLFDMAPYYLTALIHLLGPARRVSGATGQVRQHVTVANPRSAHVGSTVLVAAPMHATATIEFASGAIASLQVAKESFGYTPRLEIYGTDGILFAPDPNMFEGPIMITQASGETTSFPYSHGFSANSRGVGLADMATAIGSGRAHRASGELARHVLEITLGIFESSRAGQHIAMSMPCAQPAPLPLGLRYNLLDD